MKTFPNKICETCGLEFRILTHQAHQRTKYCSQRCASKAQKIREAKMVKENEI